MTTFRHTVHQGPLPSPATLAEYEQTIPGLAAIIVQSFAEEGPHRRELEKTALQAEIRYVSREQDLAGFGQRVLLCVVLAILAVAGVTAWRGHSLESLAGLVSSIALIWKSIGPKPEPPKEPAPDQRQRPDPPAAQD